jgi:periplasmic divalent cation tolerance protein
LDDVHVLQVQTTVDTRQEAQDLARILVETRLAACVQIVGPIESTYSWQGAVQMEAEWLCLAKVPARHFDAIAEVIRANHAYDVPEIIALPVVRSTPSYLAWIDRVATGTANMPTKERDEEMPNERFEIVDHPAKTVVGIRFDVPPDGIAAAFDEIMPAVGEFLQTSEAEMAGPPFSRYYNWGDQVDMEIGAPVVRAVPGQGRIKCSELPACRAAHALHAGTYETLGKTYGALEAWMKDEGHVPASGPWEVYLTDPREVEDPADNRTEIFWPIVS